MNRIKSLRKEKGMSQVALAMELNISQKMISAYENGKNEPSIDTLKQLADIFKTSVDYIIGYTDIRQPIDRIIQQQLTKNECDLIGEFRELSEREQAIAFGVMIGLKNYKK